MKQNLFMIIATLLYLVTFSCFSIQQHNSLRTQMNDLGYMDHAVWEASQGNLSMPQIQASSGEAKSRLSIHANYIFWIISPLYKFWPSPKLLLILACTGGAMAGLGIYFLTLLYLKSFPLAALSAFSFWALPTVQDAMLYDFHALTISTAFFVWMSWSLETRRYKISAVLGSLLLMCKEDMALVTLMLGFYYLVTSKKKIGWSLITLSLMFLFISFNVLIPYFGSGFSKPEFSGPDMRFAWLTDSFSLNEFTTRVLSPAKIRIALLFLLILGPSIRKSKIFLILLLPHLVGAFLEDMPWMSRWTGTYYWILCSAVLIISAVLASRPTNTSKKPKPHYLIYAFSASLALSLLFSPLPYSLGGFWSHYQTKHSLQAFLKIKNLIPSNASLCVQNNLGPHFSQRKYIQKFQGHCGFDYAVFYLRYVGGPDSGLFARTIPTMLTGHPIASVTEAMEKMLRTGLWQLQYNKEGFYLLKKISKYSTKINEPEVAINLIKKDKTIYINAQKEAVKSQWSVSKWLNRNYGWKDLLSIN